MLGYWPVCVDSIFKASTPYFIIYTLEGNWQYCFLWRKWKGVGGGLKGCMVLSPVCSHFCSPCFISLPFRRVPLLCNILHQSTEQTLTAHVRDYLCQSHGATLWWVFFICSSNKSCQLSVQGNCWAHNGNSHLLLNRLCTCTCSTITSTHGVLLALQAVILF